MELEQTLQSDSTATISLVPPTFQDKWFRVQLNTVVRKEKALDSERIRILPMGSRVRVVERVDRRVRINHPENGWCSLRSKFGDEILKEMSPGEKEASTPMFAETRAVEAEELKKKIERVKLQQENARKKKKTALKNAEVRALNDELSRIEQIIKNRRVPGENIEVLSPKTKSLKAKLKYTESCISQLTIENTEKEAEIHKLQHKYKKLQGQLDDVCKRHSVDNPAQLADQINKMQQDQIEAGKKIQEYHVVTMRYQKELEEMKLKLRRLLIRESSVDFSDTSAQPEGLDVHEGDVVLMSGNVGIVIVRYIGTVHWDEDVTYIGVELSDPSGDCDGTVDGTSYFDVKPNQGAFYPMTKVRKKIPAASLLSELQRQIELNTRLQSTKE